MDRQQAAEKRAEAGVPGNGAFAVAGVEAGVPGTRLVRVLGRNEQGAMECVRHNLTPQVQVIL